MLSALITEFVLCVFRIINRMGPNPVPKTKQKLPGTIIRAITNNPIRDQSRRILYSSTSPPNRKMEFISEYLYTFVKYIYVLYVSSSLRAIFLLVVSWTGENMLSLSLFAPSEFGLARRQVVVSV